ncbi:MAG: VWA domain-containing protein [Pseudomonadaceae bacterium]|nr:VWA domain-containing protein [Pseudomonadaceae bacterium]
MISLAWPWLLLALPLPLLLGRLLPPRAPDSAALRVPGLAPFAANEGALKSSGSTVSVRQLLAWLAWALLIVALSRPQWLGEATALPTTGRDLMLAVDISGSMRQEDMQLEGEKVTRLDAVKEVVGEFITRRAGDRLGLILFGTQAYLQAPLTFDLASVEQLLRESRPGMAGGKTAVGNAIALAVKRLRERESGKRVLILLTDGANNVNDITPERATSIAAEYDITIYTVGVGAEEMRMPGIFGTFGSRTINPSADLDEQSLTDIAEKTGGQYFRARNPEELDVIYNLIDELEPVDQDEATYRPTRALYFWPAAIAFLILLLGALPLQHLRRQHMQAVNRVSTDHG